MSKDSDRFQEVAVAMPEAVGEEEFHTLFPYRLHQVLSEVEQQRKTHIVSWLPCGTLFKVHDPEAFAKEVMPKIGRFTRFKSFQRQLSLYKYQRIKWGPHRGAYKHIYFRRDHINLCRGVVRGEIFYPRSKEARERAQGIPPHEAPINASSLAHTNRSMPESKSVSPFSLNESSPLYFARRYASMSLIDGNRNDQSRLNAETNVYGAPVLSFPAIHRSRQCRANLPNVTLIPNETNSFGETLTTPPILNMLREAADLAQGDACLHPGVSSDGCSRGTSSTCDILDEIIATFSV